MYGFYRRYCSKIPANEAHSHRAPKHSVKGYVWDQKLKNRLLTSDVMHGTNYYDRYLKKKAGAKERRQAMGDRDARSRIARCVIL